MRNSCYNHRRSLWVLLFILVAAGFQIARGQEAAWRKWTSSTGSVIEAKLVTMGNDEVTLQQRSGKQIKLALSKLSQADQDYLAATTPAPTAPAPAPTTEPTPATTPAPASAPVPTSAGAGSIAGIDAVPGTTSGAIACQGDEKWSYHLYLPKAFNTGRTWPVCFVMDPGGGGPGSLQRYITSADKFGIILAVSVQSKNDYGDSDLAMMAMVKDVYARVPVNKALSFATGMSGGSRMAYLMAEMNKNIAGVLACGSGSGIYLKEKTFRKAKLHHGLVVCSLEGTNCFNRREAVASHKTFNEDCRIIWFPGGHVWAEEPLITEGMAHIYAKVLLHSKDAALAPLRNSLAEVLLERAISLEKTTPWVTWRWAELLKTYPVTNNVPQQAAAIATRLASDNTVILANKADKVIDEFAHRYFADGNSQADKAEVPARLNAAEKKAEEFSSLPQAEILKKLGKPCD